MLMLLQCLVIECCVLHLWCLSFYDCLAKICLPAIIGSNKMCQDLLPSNSVLRGVSIAGSSKPHTYLTPKAAPTIIQCVWMLASPWWVGWHPAWQPLPSVYEWVNVTCSVKALWVVERPEKCFISTVHLPSPFTVVKCIETPWCVFAL